MISQSQQYSNEVARLQRIIREKNQNTQHLHREIEALKKNPRKMDNESQSEQGIQKEDSEQFLNKTELLENTIKGMTFQISALQKTCQQRNQRILDLHQKLLEAESQLRQKEYQLGELKAGHSNNSEQIIRQYEARIQQLIAMHEQQNLHTLDLARQNRKLEDSLKKQRQEAQKTAEAYRHYMNQFEKLVNQFSQQADKAQKVIEQEQLQLLKQRVFDQEKQIQQKNLEMVELYYRLSKNHNASFSESIQFMKQLLEQKAYLVKQSLNKMYEADKIINQLAKEVQLRKELPFRILQLTNQLDNQKTQKDRLKGQLSGLKDYKQKKIEQDRIRAKLLEQILLQNQHYHAIMFENYGRKHYKIKIEQVKRKMLTDIQLRRKQRRWVNVSELIQVNEALMRIVQRNH